MKGQKYDRHGRYHEPRRVTRSDRIWRGRDGRYYCRRDNGTTGLIIGATVPRRRRSIRSFHASLANGADIGLFLLLGLLAGPIILLYMLRLRRREMMVSSTMLWQKLLRDREANAPWQRLRRNLLLFLQLLILACLVFALARPYIPVPTVATGNVVVLLDASASMQSTDETPTRFEKARREALPVGNHGALR